MRNLDQSVQDHEAHLTRSFAVAERSAARGDHPFGAVLVDDGGHVLLEAGNRVVSESDCTAHAEMELIRRACKQLTREQRSVTTLYASCEPCAMCAAALHWSGIGGLVYGLPSERLYQIIGDQKDVHPLRLAAIDVLSSSEYGPQVAGPFLVEQAESLHNEFWKSN